MSEPGYAIAHSQLVRLLALCYALAVCDERAAPIAGDRLLSASDAILSNIGVKDVVEFNELVRRELGTLLPEGEPIELPADFWGEL